MYFICCIGSFLISEPIFALPQIYCDKAHEIMLILNGHFLMTNVGLSLKKYHAIGANVIVNFVDGVKYTGWVGQP